MAKIEDDKPNLDDMISPDDMVLPDEALGFAGRSGAGSAPVPMEADTAPVEDKQPKGPAPAFDDGFEPETQPPYLAIAGVIAIPIALLAIAFFGILNFSTAIYIIGLVIVSLMLWMGRKTNTVFTVLLGCVLIALMTSIYYHWDFLMKKYHGDVKAQEAKQRIEMTQPVARNVMRC